MISACEKESEAVPYMEPDNLYAGFSFEQSEEGFRHSPSTQFSSFERITSGGFDGLGCLAIYKSGFDNLFPYWSYRIYDPPAGKEIQIDFYVQLSNVSGGGFSYLMLGRNSGTGETPNYFEGEVANGFESQWKKYSCTFTKPIDSESDVIDFYVIMDENATGTLKLDKVEIIIE